MTGPSDRYIQVRVNAELYEAFMAIVLRRRESQQKVGVEVFQRFVKVDQMAQERRQKRKDESAPVREEANARELPA